MSPHRTRVELAGCSAHYLDHELDEMRALRAAGATDHELELLHTLKAGTDGLLVNEERWRRRRPPLDSPSD
jgi:hypothetical protein